MSIHGHVSALIEQDNSSVSSKTLSEFLHARTSSGKWVHTTTELTLAWLLISIPLVIWDLGFVLLRPWSMPGCSLNWPIWALYEHYTRTDYIYGWKAINEKNGFTAAQASMNVPESILYLCYLYLIYSNGIKLKAARGGPNLGILARRSVAGQPGALALIAGFAAAVMTFSKTVLYGLNEAFSGWSNVGHNEWMNLVFLWIIPNGAWLIASALMSVEFGCEILHRLSLGAGTVLPEETPLTKVK